jgi:hypothetical protein
VRGPVGDRTAFEGARGRLSVHSRSPHASTSSCASARRTASSGQLIKPSWRPSPEDGLQGAAREFYTLQQRLLKTLHDYFWNVCYTGSNPRFQQGVRAITPTKEEAA